VPKPLWTVLTVALFAYAVYVCLLIDRSRYSERAVLGMVLLTFIPFFGALAVHLYLMADSKR
jgi:hypothetical protein